jgi:hypothetical protein
VSRPTSGWEGPQAALSSGQTGLPEPLPEAGPVTSQLTSQVRRSCCRLPHPQICRIFKGEEKGRGRRANMKVIENNPTFVRLSGQDSSFEVWGAGDWTHALGGRLRPPGTEPPMP